MHKYRSCEAIPLKALLFLFWLLLPSPCLASDWYGSLAGSFSHLANTHNHDGAIGSQLDFANGYGLNGAIGYTLPKGFRIEGEVGYYKNEINQLAIPAIGSSFSTSGQANRWVGLASLYYDINPDSEWSPYIGAGIGAAYYDIRLALPLLGTVPADDFDHVLARHISAGITRKINENASVFAGYRFLVLDDLRLVDVTPKPVSIGRNESHNIQLGLRWSF